MPKLKPGETRLNWQYLLKRYLLEGGTVGYKQGDINKKFNSIPSDEILQELEALWAEEKVQRFSQRTHGVTATVWRATEALNT